MNKASDLVSDFILRNTEYLIPTSYSNKVALIFREFGFYNWTDVIMNDLHEGLSQARFISSLRLLKLCQSFLSHSKTFKISFPGIWNHVHSILLLSKNLFY